MVLNYSTMVDSIAKNIAKNRKAGKRRRSSRNIEAQYKNAMQELRRAQANQSLKATLDILQNPLLIVSTIHHQGISGVLKDLLAPVAVIEIQKSSLKTSNKIKLLKGINRVVSGVDHVEHPGGTKTQNNTEQKPEQHLKVVA
jgi:hypothetical protein